MVTERIVKTSKIHRMTEPKEGFDMAILPPRETGLLFVVFILQDLGIIPEVRIEIARSHRATVRLKDGYLDAQELALLTRWVDLNRDALIKYWDGEIESTTDVLRVFKPVAAQ